jgi:hypothetical protein
VVEKPRPVVNRVEFPIIKASGSGRKITPEDVNRALEEMYEEEARAIAVHMRR